MSVTYFSAFATWLPDAYKRHREYVKALQTLGVDPIMAYFKEKDRKCHKCGNDWKSHEEKETDVHIGLHILNQAYKDSFDHAFLVSNDSDLAPVIRMLRSEFPHKRVRLITPPKRRHSKDLVGAAGGKQYVRTIKETDLRRFLMPQRVKDASGTVAAVRPTQYDPPAGP